LRGAVSQVGRSEIGDPQSKKMRELDVVAVGFTEKGTGSEELLAIGEAKATKASVGLKELNVLVAKRALLERQGLAQPGRVRLLLFSMGGFTQELVQHCASLRDVELIDLTRLYQEVRD
jgi:hypothetical protein